MPNTDRKVTCRYLRRGAQGQCTAEAVDPNGEIMLCVKHLGRALELVYAAGWADGYAAGWADGYAAGQLALADEIGR